MSYRGARPSTFQEIARNLLGRLGPSDLRARANRGAPIIELVLLRKSPWTSITPAKVTVGCWHVGTLTTRCTQ